MVNIIVDNKGFNIDEQRLIYDLYYFDSELYDAPTLAGTFKKILIKWANVLRESNMDKAPLFLPFAPDDQWTECLKADLHGDRVVLRYVRVAVGGYQIDVDQLEDFMTSTHAVEKEGSEGFGDYDRDEFVSALINAQVIDE